jgi:hypothetical protein
MGTRRRRDGPALCNLQPCLVRAIDDGPARAAWRSRCWPHSTDAHRVLLGVAHRPGPGRPAEARRRMKLPVDGGGGAGPGRAARREQPVRRGSRHRRCCGSAQMRSPAACARGRPRPDRPDEFSVLLHAADARSATAWARRFEDALESPTTLHPAAPLTSRDRDRGHDGDTDADGHRAAGPEADGGRAGAAEAARRARYGA